MLPFELVEHQDFKALFKELAPGYQVPSRRYFSDVAIPKEYAKTVSSLKDDLAQKCYKYSVTTDVHISYDSLHQPWI